MSPWLRAALLAALFAIGVPSAVRAGPPWASGTTFNYTDRADGASCTFFDMGLGIPWPTSGAQWEDAAKTVGGASALATHVIEPGDSRRVRTLDVTSLVKSWWSGEVANDGMLLSLVRGDYVRFHAREEADAVLRPRLRLHMADGSTRHLEAAVDVALDCSTFKPQGALPVLGLTRKSSLLLRFDLDGVRAKWSMPARAELTLVRTPDSSTGAATLAVFRLHDAFHDGAPPQLDGIASRHPGDAGLASHQAVVFYDDFESGPDRRWDRRGGGRFESVGQDAENGFEALAGKALKITIARGEQVGADLRLKLRGADGTDPQAMYFRYYLRLSRSWRNATDGGKMAGFAGTYGKAGWGGRRWDGRVGWSMRGSYGLPAAADHGAAGYLMLGTYAYHAKSDTYGEGFPWTGGGLAGLVPFDRWVCIEQYLKLNQPGREDGVFKVWVDGRQAFAKSDLRLRDVDTVRIEEVWLNIFHGGTSPAPAAMHAYVDQLVVAREYIGPMKPAAPAARR